MQIFLSLTEWKRLVNTYGMSSAAAAAKSNTDFHSLRTKAEARGLLPSNFLILLSLNHRRGIQKTRTIHAIYESFIIREVLDIPIFFAAHKNQTPREGGKEKSSTKTPLKNWKKNAVQQKTQLFSFVRICNSFSLFLYSSATTLTTTTTSTTKVRMFCGKHFAKRFPEDMAKYYEQKNRVFLDE